MTRSNAGAARNVWLVSAFDYGRSYAGNEGYADVHGIVYRYDDDVPNHRRVEAGDLLVVRSLARLEGFARVDRIETETFDKTSRRCPVCAIANVRERRTASLRFRCKKGHEFEVPTTTVATATAYSAFFAAPFVAAPRALSLEELRDVCAKWNQQLAMQRVDQDRLVAVLARRAPDVGARVMGLLASRPKAAGDERSDG